MNRRNRIEALERRTATHEPVAVILMGCERGESGPTPTSAARMGGTGEPVERQAGEAESAFIARAHRELMPDAETVVALPAKEPTA
ncbi:MAG: hypothetical protein ACX94A_03210 [Algiphilus sp.]